MADRFWVGGTGNWSDDTNHWATTSGGSPGAGNLPTASDNAIFDAASNTTAYTVTVDATGGTKNCLDIRFEAAPSVSGTVTWTGSTAMNVAGSILLLAGMTQSYQGTLTMTATSGTRTITSNGARGPRTVVFNGSGATFQLADNYEPMDNGSMTRTAGTFDANGMDVTFRQASSVSGFNASHPFFNLIHTGAATGTLTFSNATTITGTFTATGDAANSRSVVQGNVTSALAIAVTAATTALQDVDFRYITGAGAAAWTGTRLGDAQGNSGITFDAPVNSYYVRDANAGWSNSANWSASSGGAASVNAYPKPQDTAIFDANSFSASGRTVIMSGSSQDRVGHIDTTAVDHTFTFEFDSSDTFPIYGNVSFGANTLMTSSAPTGSDVIFVGAEARTISLVNAIPTRVSTQLAAGARLTLASNVTCNESFTFARGELDLGGNVLTCRSFVSTSTGTREIEAGGGRIESGGTGTIFDFSIASSGITFVDEVILRSTSAGSSARTYTAVASNAAFVNARLEVTAGSGAFTVTGSIGDLDFTGFAGSLAAAVRQIYGDLVISTGMSVTATTSLTTFAGTSGTGTITSNGKTLDFPITINGAGRAWTLVDDLVVGATRTMTLTAGSFDLDGNDLSVGLLSSSNSNVRALDLGSGTVTLTGTGTVWNLSTSTNIGLTPGSSLIQITNASASSKTFAGGGLTYNDLLLTGAGSGQFIISGNNTFADFSADTPPHTLSFTSGSTQHVTTFDVNGTAGNLMTIQSTAAGQHFLVKDGGGVIVCSYLNINDSNASPADTTWFADDGTSVDGGGNTGWVLTAPVEGSIEESVSITDSVSASISYAGTISESSTGEDSVSVEKYAGGSIAESLVIQDNLAAVQVSARSIDESVSAVDLINGGVERSFSIAESLATEDFVTTPLLFSLSESLAISDRADRWLGGGGRTSISSAPKGRATLVDRIKSSATISDRAKGSVNVEDR